MNLIWWVKNPDNLGYLYGYPYFDVYFGEGKSEIVIFLAIRNIYVVCQYLPWEYFTSNVYILPFRKLVSQGWEKLEVKLFGRKRSNKKIWKIIQIW